ncbi:MAG TPA: hypothetical protein VK421_05985 [Pyrinomonadaceae bacterium]|nr:hypothetical protein [Pyrinomonadaceae bacterium]
MADMDEQNEQSWLRGNKAAYRAIMAECLRNLGHGDRDARSWALERADVILVLRDLCERYGDNEWPDDLHLGDVLRKHLEPHLEG